MKHRFAIEISIAMLGALLLSSPASAQRGFGGRAAPSGHAVSGRSFAAAGRGTFRYAHAPRSAFRHRRGGWGYGLGWSDLFYPGDYGLADYDPADYPPPMMGPPQAEMYEAPEPVKVIRPILIERQGDAWVKVSGYNEAPAASPSQPVEPREASQVRAAPPGLRESAEPAAQVPFAVLVFRDGHQEQVKSYTIIDGTLYAKADYWVDGSWTRKIELASLDVPATLKLNQEHGSQFKLPSGPREIIIRP